MRDAVTAHQAGIPTVLLVHGPFEPLARTQAAVLTATDLPIIVYKQDALARDTDSEITAKAKEVAQRISAALIK